MRVRQSIILPEVLRLSWSTFPLAKQSLPCFLRISDWLLLAILELTAKCILAYYLYSLRPYSEFCEIVKL